jgi:DNA-binding response OmpR family regulator
LVEDNRSIRELMGEFLADEGYRFVIVASGAETRVALAADPAIDIAIIDLGLASGEDGQILAGEVADRGIPVILVTGNHARARALQAGGSRYLLKPFRMDSLIEMIEVVLAEVQAQCQRDSGRCAS